MGYQTGVNFGEGVRRTIEWEQANHVDDEALPPQLKDYAAQDEALAAIRDA